MSSIPATMQAAQFLKANSQLEVVTVPVPTLAPNEVLVKVEACGLCSGDVLAQTGHFPGVQYPRTPGHEIIGRIAKKGSQTPAVFQESQLVGVGWHDQHCFSCTPCRKGDVGFCRGHGPFPTATGLSQDGGLAQYVAVRWEALVVVPEEWSTSIPEAAPLLCAGMTVFNSLRHAEVSPGEVVVVHGVGGLGHLAVQYASRMGYYTVAVTSSASKHAGALALGAKEALTASEDGAHLARIRELGGAKVVLASAPDAKGIATLAKALAHGGTVMVLGVPHEPIPIDAMSLIMSKGKIVGWASGIPTDAEETLKASALLGIKSVVETFPLAKAAEGYKAMVENKVRFRAVILPNA